MIAEKKNIRKRTASIRGFILNHIPDYPKDVVQLTCQAYDISRQAVNRHIKVLEKDGLIEAIGTTRNKEYKLKKLFEKNFTKNLDGLQEDRFWRDDVLPLINDLPRNVIDIWHYGFTEMVNNAIDHSNGTGVYVVITGSPINTEITVADNGIGIFKKIQQECGLEDERHAVLELAKGKLTTDPDNHSGEGIFFSSRMFDRYKILSGEVYFSHQSNEEEDWIIEADENHVGTVVSMDIRNNSKRTDTEVYDKFKSENEEYGFTKTVVPVKLVKHGKEKLVSRSQAKRLLARVDRFKTVIFDFRDVDSIGQAFADEIFRVFINNNPNINVSEVYANKDILNMINRVKHTDDKDVDQLNLL